MVGRVTRKKAAEIAESLHIDEDAVLDANIDDAAVKAKLATPEPGARAPLGELEPNSSESNTPEELVEELKKSTRGRKAGKKGAKGKKDKLAASTVIAPEEGDIMPDDNESAPSPASEEATEELINADSKVAAASVRLQDRSQSPPSAAVRLTRRQLAKQAEEPGEAKNVDDEISQDQDQQQGYFVSGNNPTIETHAPADASAATDMTALDAPASPLPGAIPNVVRNLRSDTPAKRSTSNKENVEPELTPHAMRSSRPQSSVYDALEDAVVAAATPPRSETRTSPRPEDQIAALDELEDAVENVSKDIPEVQESPQKPKHNRKVQQIAPEPVADAPKTEEKRPVAKKDSKKVAPVVRTTKAAQARISMAQNKDRDAAGRVPSLGKPRPSTTLGRSTSLRQSVAPKSEAASQRVPSNPTPGAAARSKSRKASTDGEQREKKETVIPHSKPRPISLSFPTPPPPPKSTKATTQSTFQLPGEAIAAKLKAAREARLAKESEDAEKKEKKPAFKARPAPKTTGEVPAVRQTNASRARESIMTGKPASAPTSFKRSNTVTAVDRPRTASKETATKLSTLSTSTPGTLRPRPSTSLANLSKPRTSVSASIVKPATGQRVPSNGTTAGGTSKGKEVFARTANAKAAAEKEKAEKEAAAKRARAEAAERGRVASREWAEKQRLKKLGLKAEKKEEKTAVSTPTPAEGGVEGAAARNDGPEQQEKETEAVAAAEEIEAAAV